MILLNFVKTVSQQTPRLLHTATSPAFQSRSCRLFYHEPEIFSSSSGWLITHVLKAWQKNPTLNHLNHTWTLFDCSLIRVQWRKQEGFIRVVKGDGETISATSVHAISAATAGPTLVDRQPERLKLLTTAIKTKTNNSEPVSRLDAESTQFVQVCDVIDRKQKVFLWTNRWQFEEEHDIFENVCN